MSYWQDRYDYHKKRMEEAKRQLYLLKPEYPAIKYNVHGVPDMSWFYHWNALDTVNSIWNKHTKYPQPTDD